MSCSQKRWLLCKTQRSQFSKKLPVKITWKDMFSMFFMSSQFPRLSHCVHHRIEVPLLNCFVSAEKNSLPRKATFLWKYCETQCLFARRIQWRKRGGNSWLMVHILWKEEKRTESSRKFEHMIKDALDIWVILRCWGNSSMVCQQNSDAL